MKILRTTKNYCVVQAARSLRLQTRENNSTPKSRALKPSDWEYLNALSDTTFDMAAVFDFGVGVFIKRRRKPKFNYTDKRSQLQ